MEEITKADLKTILAQDPGNPVFADAAEELRQQGDYLGGIEMCLAGLSANPQCHKGRLTLARLYYERNFIPFAISELRQLKSQLPGNYFLEKLLLRIAPDAEIPTTQTTATSEPTETVAETVFDFDQLDMIEKAEQEKKS